MLVNKSFKKRKAHEHFVKSKCVSRVDLILCSMTVSINGASSMCCVFIALLIK